MQLFKLGTVIHEFDNFAEFAKGFNLGERDLVITNAFLHEPFMANLGLKCKFVMQEKYGLGEPNDEMMNAILRDTKGTDFDRVIAVGGGTVIDISKLFVLKGLGEDVLPAFDKKIPLVKEKELVIIPTTSGTGSEVTNISIAEIKSRHTKMGLADDAILADHAVIIPELLRGLPFKFWAASSIDALIHAVESYVSPKANVYTRMCSLTAMNTILDVFKGVAAKGEEYRYERMGDMLMAANIAGIAFGNAGVGAVHALSYPLGGNYHVPHGESNYQFFTTVFKAYQAKKPQGSIVELNEKLAAALGCEASVVYERMDDLLGRLIAKKPLREYGMKDEEVRGFAESVLQTQQRLLNNNYVELSVDEIEAIYRSLF
ncbi:4-hydroxybutyrate dehydrogenase [Porphyromonas crevioricanis]|uniref:4-hydroxybutyrate dehydrogenase n=2 Tax=Porphyromonas crevioricanis TaxID=393921 RepID=A0A0A2FSX8_9PORP|nr:4-hydroxybutyrate dehydrogenase [Porphyromonas crevioricanis]KGN89934.1 4-hydroxybutyrate dehydrogenase [Porphyromonas crevioricanis]KGN94118.1 4-hydroxybutyrate dehydrogenase [Porphyromonas crevioricanis]SJZ66057.1 4-hydroxybutyrate dehydrogenase [Porphyromonas crevioricanis]SQH73925.1 Alcohol dehydrogenase 2 [Porphyromonas crevioricanis]GAD04770.1 NAD-dependent 4-hydroxybutyrate dehydrogenase [Porphyromonas crevioricanis JCM 15906]